MNWIRRLTALVVLLLIAGGLVPPAAQAARLQPATSALLAALPAWCKPNDTIGVQYGSRFDACRFGGATMDVSGSELGSFEGFTVQFRMAVLMHTYSNSPTVDLTYLFDVYSIDGQSEALALPLAIKAGKPRCDPACTGPDFTNQPGQQIPPPFTKLVEFNFETTTPVADGQVLSPTGVLPLAWGQVPALGETYYRTADVDRPIPRCDRRVAGARSAGCVFDQPGVTPNFQMDWSTDRYPQVAAHIRDAAKLMGITLGPSGKVYHRTDAGQRKVNRQNACGRLGATVKIFSDELAVQYPGQYSCDEFPFASTEEGGDSSAVGTPYKDSDYFRSGKVGLLNTSSKLSVALLSNDENGRHGRALGRFYLANRILQPTAEAFGNVRPGDAFTISLKSDPPTYTPPVTIPDTPSNLNCVSSGTASASALRAVSAACRYVGTTSYTYGGGHGPYPGPSYGYYDGEDPASLNDGSVFGFDCSGFVRWAWYLATGSDFLDGSAQMQRNKLAAAPTLATKVASSQLQPGDVVFFGGAGRVHHVALYVGDHKVVEARQSGTKIMVSALNSHDDYYEAYRPAVSGTGQTDTGANAFVWATSVNVRATASTTATKVATIPGQQSITISCQAKGESVVVGNAASDYWSKVPALGGWISNVFIRGEAVIAGIPACSGSTLPATGSGGKFQVWAGNVNVRAAATSAALKTGTIVSPRSVNVVCQMVGQQVTEGAYSSSYWSKITEPAGYISNVYVKGLDKLDGVPLCSGNATPPTTQGYYQTWASNVNVRASASTGAAIVGGLPDPSTIDIICQSAGSSVTDGGFTSSYWSKIAEPAGFVSNVYIKGPAKLPNIPTC